MPQTVRDVTFELLRKLGLTTVFGNPGSTEETFLKNFPKDFRYIQTLQEASAVGAADGFAQGMRHPALVNVHTSAGLSNGMSNVLTAFMNRTPLIITAGNQTRDMLLMEPWLTNVQPSLMPKPWVKWSYEPVRAQDVPAAFMRAYAIATQPPMGPVFLSIPLDDWDQPFEGVPVLRSVASRIGPDPARIADFAEALSKAKNPVLIYGAAIAREQGWPQAIALAEKLDAPVWAAPASERTPFPENHRLYAGGLPFAIGPLSQKLAGHDLAIVIGAPVFRYYPYVAGSYLPEGLRLLHVTDDPAEAGRAPVGDSLLSDAVLAIEALTRAVAARPAVRTVVKQPHNMAPHAASSAKPAGASASLDRLLKTAAPAEAELALALDVEDRPAARPVDRTPHGALPQPVEEGELSALELFRALRAATPRETVLVEESPSNLGDLHTAWPIELPDSFYTFASGSLGWNLPAAVGIALAERDSGRNRPVLAVIGDGSLQYSIQGLWTAAQQGLPILYVVPRNGEYGILKSFAVLEETPGVPGLDLPGLDIVALAKGYGCTAVRAETVDEVRAVCAEAFTRKGPTVLEVPIAATIPPLI
ncbi:benzoylformate decarboxylase [Kaistia sp. 32K]|uniref:thiamine pyrophosphate-dependent enzyme n=1 Tax=Kaistia sp. 32K TaxID=2795690 RepID=UPI001915015E|nr:thiamine pyrophosphate-dependent enzyme [Kaistia sp. 32K]BCP56353.1 benzoylformate decarboxylase [Kaistia sp. 32K]